MSSLGFQVSLGQDLGWATLKVNNGYRELEIDCSYIIDTLSQIARGLQGLSVQSGSFKAECETESHGIWILRFRRIDDVFELVIKCVQDCDGARKQSRPARLRYRGDWSSALSKLVAALVRLRDEHGPTIYRQRWGHDFPTNEIAQLSAAIAATD